MKKLEALYKLKNGYSIPKSFLGVDISKFDVQDHRGKETECWGFSCSSYITRIITELEAKLRDELQYRLPTHAVSPLSTNYHPEIDDTDELDDRGIEWHQGLVGTLRWMVEIGRIDISHAVSVMSSYLVAPRVGHLFGVLHIYAYLKYKPTLSLVLNPGDFMQSIGVKSISKDDWIDFYPGASENIPPTLPKPRGLPVSITAFVDADHAGNIANRRSHSGIIVFVQSSPIIWLSKQQKTVETSTHGVELIATRIGVEIIESLRFKLRSFGIPIEGPSVVYCDNQSVVHNAQRPESVLKKKHNSVSYHKIRESVAAEIITVYKIASGENHADLLTKALSGNVTSYHADFILLNEDLWSEK